MAAQRHLQSRSGEIARRYLRIYFARIAFSKSHHFLHPIVRWTTTVAHTNLANRVVYGKYAREHF